MAKGRLSARGTVGLLAFSPLLLMACRGRMLRVDVPAGYTGTVRIECAALVQEPETIRVDQTGVAQATCPAREMPVSVLRAGQPLEKESRVTWESTGDGIPRVIRIELR